jgi:hypothetical protein
MVDRDIGSALLEFVHGIAANHQEIRDEPVGGGGRRSGFVDKPRLGRVPCLGKSCVIGWRKRLDVEPLHSFLTPLQFRLGAIAIPVVGHCAIIFGAECLMESLAVAPTPDHAPYKADHYDQQDDDDDGQDDS